MFPFYSSWSLVFWCFKWVQNCSIAWNWVSSYLKLWWVISFLLESFARISWIAWTRLTLAWIYFQGSQSWIIFAWINFHRWIQIFVLNFSCEPTRLHGQRAILHHPAKCGGIGLAGEEILSSCDLLWSRDKIRASSLWVFPHHMSAPCKVWWP